MPLAPSRGFSGAQIWRLTAGDRPYCLRRWPPEHPDPPTLAAMHAVLLHVARVSSVPVPPPHPTRDGQTFVAYYGALWELTDWLPGRASFRQAPTAARLSAAMGTLAEFHRAVQSYEAVRSGPSPGLHERLGTLRRLLDGEALQLLHQVERTAWPEFQQRARRLIAGVLERGPQLLARLAAATEPVPLPFSIRDVWYEHILFDDDRVTGLIDFGAMRRETRAGDVARLLGSLAGNNAEHWRAGMAAYNQVCPMTDAEQALVPLFDSSGVLLGGMNWVRWIAAEGRQFDSPSAVLERMDEHLLRQVSR